MTRGMTSKDGVELVPYRAEWPALYKEEEAVLRTLLGDEIVQIDHFGSTSVPEMAAKPLIDILIQTNSGVLSDKAAQTLDDHGYQLKIFPDRKEIMYMKGDEACRTHNIHIAKAGGVFATSMLAFRDALRNDPVIAQEYKSLKTELAERYPDDRKRYYNDKIAFFQKALGISTRYPGQE